MAYSAQERLEILKRNIDTNSVKLELNGVEYDFSPLAIGGIKVLNGILTNQSEDAIDSWIKLALLSISRVLPDVTQEELEIAIDSTNFSKVKDTLLNLSGYVTKSTEQESPNVQAAASTQTENQEPVAETTIQNQ